MDPKARFKLRQFIKELEQYRARHTELISVYVPAGYDLNKVISQLSQEQSTARNIKSTSTRKNVLDALEKMIRELRVYRKTPEHGLAIFSGNISGEPGISDVRVWSIEPPIPLKTRIYRCDQTFFLEPLKEMLLPTDAYGLLVLDRREADIAFVKGKSIIPVASFKSVVPGKFRAGGQSAARFARVRENLTKDFFKRVGDAAAKTFAEAQGLRGIIIGGPGPTKEDFFRGNFLPEEIKKKVIGLVDTGYTGEAGLEETVNRAEDLLAKSEITQEKKIVKRFFDILSKKPNFVAYGREEVKRALDMNAVEVLLLSEKVEPQIIEQFSEKAELSGTEWFIISEETREGVQLASFGGIAAILRFPIG